MNITQQAMETVSDEEIVQGVADELTDFTGGLIKVNEEGETHVIRLRKNLHRERVQLESVITDSTTALAAVNVAIARLGDDADNC